MYLYTALHTRLKNSHILYRRAKLKSKLLFQTGIAIVALLTIAFSTGQAYASTGCFNDTNGHWAETFICWMKDNGITAGTGGGNYSPENYVTRAEMAVFMQKQAEIPPSKGDITINASGQIWDGFSNSSYVLHGYGYSELSSTVAANQGFVGTIAVPTRLYNAPTYLDGMQICYNATLDVAYIDMMTLTHFKGMDGTSTAYSDQTNRNGEGCVKLALPTPILLNSED